MAFNYKIELTKKEIMVLQGLSREGGQQACKKFVQSISPLVTGFDGSNMPQLRSLYEEGLVNLDETIRRPTWSITPKGRAVLTIIEADMKRFLDGVEPVKTRKPRVTKDMRDATEAIAATLAA